MTSKIEFYTLAGLAKKEGVRTDYLRKLTSQFRKTGGNQWRQYRFYPIGETGRGCWLAYEGDQQVVIYDA